MDKEELSAFIAELKERLMAEWSERNDYIEEMRSIRFMERPVEVPSHIESEIVRTPIAYQTVEHVVGALTADPPMIKFPPPSESMADLERSSRLEKAISAALSEIARQQADEPEERFIESLIADGHGCMRILYAPQYWAGMPKRNRKGGETAEEYNKRVEQWKRGRRIPIHWAWCDPLTVYPLFGEMGLEAVMEVDRRDPISLNWRAFNQGYDALSIRSPELRHLTRYEGYGTVEFTQVWLPGRLVYLVGDLIVHDSKVAYEEPPYIYSYGVATNSLERDKRGLSILHGMRYLHDYMDRLLSQKATGIRIYYWPTPVVKLSNRAMPGGELGQPREIEVVPGKPVTLWEGEEIGFLTWPVSGPDDEQMTSLVYNMLQRAGLSDAFYGEANAGSSGYLISQLIATARLRFKPIVTHAERAMEQLIQRLMDIVEYQIKSPIYVYHSSTNKEAGWLKLDPKDMNGYRNVIVKINMVLPTDEYARSSRAINEMQAGLRSRASAMEMIGIEQPDEMMREIDVDNVIKRPEIQAVLAEEALKRLGLKMEQDKGSVNAAALLEQYPTLPAALRQALMMQAQGSEEAPSVLTAPGIQGLPTPPGGAAGVGQVGPQIRPIGQATGLPTGPQMGAEEAL